jgi:hypothetical protein
VEAVGKKMSVSPFLLAFIRTTLTAMDLPSHIAYEDIHEYKIIGCNTR